ncbi:hypothetical protein [Jannaschia formosa]|uniref:hypothetical protein n=1 Tax=Jannaschia formosa TaxID=2259592 RepID=UPI001431FA2D|nr:hypothetical protein [Jannaschia formosa]
MNVCFESAKTGTFCLGDALGGLHGGGLTAGHLGLGILAVIAVAIGVFILRNPA